jgi:hypothetical protein
VPRAFRAPLAARALRRRCGGSGEGEDSEPAGWRVLEKNEGDQDEEHEEGGAKKEEKKHGGLLAFWGRKKVVAAEEAQAPPPPGSPAVARASLACTRACARPALRLRPLRPRRRSPRSPHPCSRRARRPHRCMTSCAGDFFPRRRRRALLATRCRAVGRLALPRFVLLCVFVVSAPVACAVHQRPRRAERRRPQRRGQP